MRFTLCFVCYVRVSAYDVSPQLTNREKRGLGCFFEGLVVKEKDKNEGGKKAQEKGERNDDNDDDPYAQTAYMLVDENDSDSVESAAYGYGHGHMEKVRKEGHMN